MNGYKISVNINTTECSVKVLEKALKAIDVLEEHYYYFSLFLIRKEQDGGVTLVRKLMDFESPFISHKLASECKIVIRKSYWDAAYDLELIKHKISLNLLYIQTLNDIERGWIIATKGIKEDLTTLQATGRKHSYMLMVRELPSYGCLQFSNVNSDYPDDNTQATVIVGCKELGIRTSVGKKIQETKFKVTRMRCWRVTTIVDSDKLKSKNPPEDASANSNTYELSFEYLMAKNCLKWIKLTTCSAMIISVCLQNMVDELLNQKNGQDVNNIQTTPNSVAQLDYIRRENVNTKLQESSSDSSISNLVSVTFFCSPIYFNRTVLSFRAKPKLFQSRLPFTRN